MPLNKMREKEKPKSKKSAVKKERKQIGELQPPSRVGSGTVFLDKMGSVNEGDFVFIPDDNGSRQIGRVSSIEIDADDDNQYAEAEIEWLGRQYQDRKDRLELLKFPAEIDSPVFKLRSEEISDMYRLNDQGGLLIGTLEGGIPIRINPQRLTREHTGLFGRTRSGKSYATRVIIEEFAKQKSTVLIIDPHGEYDFSEPDKAQDVVAELSLLKLSPAGFKQNNIDILDSTPNLQKMSVGDRFAVISESEDTSTVACYEVVKHTEDSPNTVSEVSPSGLIVKGMINHMGLAGLRSDDSKLFVADYLEELFEERKRLSKTGHKLDKLIIVIDEAHIFVPQFSEYIGSKEVIETLIKESAKFNTSLLLLSQRPQGISTTVRDNLGNQFIFRITSSNSRKIVIDMGEGLTGDWDYVVKNLPVGQCVVSGTCVDAPIIFNVRRAQSKVVALNGGVSS